MKKISTFEAACILCGYGVGGTIMTMPFLATKAGTFQSVVILICAYAIGMLIAMYTADVAIKARSITGSECQVLTQFELFLFNGPLKKILTIIYFVFLALIAVSNLAADVAESGQLVAALLPVTDKIGSVIFYVFAAAVVLIGIRGVAIGERAMIILMFAILAVLAVPSFGNFTGNPLPTGDGDPLSALRYYGYAIMALSAPLAIPQVVDGLDGDKEAIKKYDLIDKEMEELFNKQDKYIAENGNDLQKETMNLLKYFFVNNESVTKNEYDKNMKELADKLKELNEKSEKNN